MCNEEQEQRFVIPLIDVKGFAILRWTQIILIGKECFAFLRILLFELIDFTTIYF